MNANTSDDFRSLTVDEVDAVGGGILPFIIAAAIVVAADAAIGAYIAYQEAQRHQTPAK